MYRAILALSFLLTGACATTGATLGSGVGDAMLTRSPWYAGARTTPLAADERVGVLPIGYQARAGEPASFGPSQRAGSPLNALIEEMNAYLATLPAANGTLPVRIELAAANGGPRRVAPDVRFGCLTTGDLPGEDCAARGDSALGRGPFQQMKLAVGRPSAAWVTDAAAAMAGAGVGATLVITLEVGDHLLRQTGAAGRKSVDLGTGHTVSLPWMTSLETPVQVLQLTGALVGPDGKALRIGAEGITAKRTRLMVSAIGGQETISDADVELARTARRDDLPGEPLAWQEALRQLVLGLTR